MRIKLIAPARKPEWGESFWDLKTLCKLTGRKSGGAPLALPTLAALTPSDVEVVLTDENVEPVNFEEKVDLIGITGMTCVIPRSYEIADEFRKRGVAVVMGGIHVSMLPEEAAQHCDAVVIGEAEEIWEQVVSDAQKKNLQKFYRAPRFPDLTNTPVPRWDLLKNEKYFYFTMQTGRGCPYDCDFCTVKVFNGREYRHKTIRHVIKELDTLQRIDPQKLVFFADDNLFAVPEYNKELLREISLLKIKSWWCQSSINRLDNEALLDLMYEAGCRVIFVGFESVIQNSLEAMNKSHVNKVEEYDNVTNSVHSHRMALFGSFVLGSDGDDEKVFQETSNFIHENNIPFAMINVITPFPGSKLQQRLEVEGRIINKNWSDYNAEKVCFNPRLISKGILEAGRKKVLQNIYSYDNLYKRFCALWNKGVFVRNGRSTRQLFTRGRILFSLKAFLWFDKKRSRFVFHSLWNRTVTSVSAVSSALNYHDYTKSLDSDG